MVRESSTNSRSVSPNADQGGDKDARDRPREPVSSDRNLRDKVDGLLVYKLRNSDKVLELYSENLKCLEPNKYLNDEVVRIYIAHLLYDVCSLSTQKKTHVFDNYFHHAVRETFKAPCKEYPVIKKDLWKRLNKWYNGTDIFEKSFLIFPICQDDHWSAIIVCYPSEVPEYDTEESASPDQSSDSRNKPVPGVIVLESLGMKAKMLSKDVRLFLDFEWRSRFTVIKDFYYHSLKEYKPNLPKQTNAFDCGIFVLAYLRAFIQSPEQFYKHVRRNEQKDQELLTCMVNEELYKCSRESIKNTIYKICGVSDKGRR